MSRCFTMKPAWPRYETVVPDAGRIITNLRVESARQLAASPMLCGGSPGPGADLLRVGADPGPFSLDLDGPNPTRRAPGDVREGGEDAFDVTPRGDEAVVPEDSPRGDDDLRGDKAAAADRRRPGEERR